MPEAGRPSLFGGSVAEAKVFSGVLPNVQF